MKRTRRAHLGQPSGNDPIERVPPDSYRRIAPAEHYMHEATVWTMR
jgi:hypothetical protein